MFSPARRIAFALLLALSTVITSFTVSAPPAYADIQDSAKYAAIASTFSFVRVVSSIAVKSRAKAFMR